MSIHIEHLLVDLLNNTAQQTPTLWIADESLSAEEMHAARPNEHLHVLTNRFDLCETMRAIGHQVILSDFDFSQASVQAFTHIIYRVSKERPLVHHCINESYKHLVEGGQLHLIGAKDDGIRTHGRKAEQVFSNPEQAKKHGDIYHIQLTKPAADTADEPQWLDCKDYAKLRPCTVGDLHFMSKPGVFGWNKVDRGSVLLSDHVRTLLPKKKDLGSVLDMGCGYGYLLLASAALPFSERYATDNNAAAIDAATASFAKANLNVHVSLDDCAQNLQTQVDWILCNPPFHQGFQTSSALSEKFIRQMRRVLKPKGKAFVVVNQFIPLERLAQDVFTNVDLVVQEHGFKLIQLS
ncbi:MAG: class I SAM-dependent methyltransferase [Gammaproteobacteria bacterium]